MCENALTTALFIVGSLVIIILAAVAIFLHWQLHLRKQRDAQRFAEQEEKIAQNRQEASHSLRIIAKSYLADQVELGEASIRISRVMDYLEMNDAQRMPYKVFDQVHAKISHIPILGEWKTLPKKEKREHLKTIQSVEKEYEDFAKDAAKNLVDFELVEVNFYAASL